MESNKPTVFLGLDIGGTLAKMCVFLPVGAELELAHIQELKISLREGTILFARYENDDLTDLFEDLKKIKEKFSLQTMHVTGGGAFKYHDQLKEIDKDF